MESVRYGGTGECARVFKARRDMCWVRDWMVVIWDGVGAWAGD